MTSALDALMGEASSPARTATSPARERGLPFWPDSLPDHLSATQIAMYQRCPEQYRRRYVLGERERPGAALIWGAADHYAHEQNFTQKILTGQDIPVAEVKLAFAEGFDQAVDRNGGESEIEWGKDTAHQLKDDGARLVAVYHELASPKVQPTAVEVDFTLNVPNCPVPVVGRVDVQTAGPGIERKTAKRSSTKVEPKWRLQGLIYQLASTKEIDYHVSVKTKTPAVLTPEQHPDLALPYVPGRVAAAEKLISQTAQRIATDFATFGPDEPWQGALSHDWACDYCGWRATCAWWGNS